MTEEEVGLVANLSPQTAEEARTLVPTLQVRGAWCSCPPRPPASPQGLAG